MNLAGLAQRTQRKLATSATARASLFLMVGSMLGHLGNYLYYVVSARAVGPVHFAEVSALVAGVSMIAFMPFGGVQAAVAREIARLQASGQDEGIGALVRKLVRNMMALCLGMVAVLLLVTPLAVSLLDLSSNTIWMVTAVYIALGIGQVSLLGVAQGLSRFTTVGVMLGGPLGALRPLLVLPLVAVAAATGAIWALLAATLVGLAILGWVIAPYLKRAATVATKLPRLWTTFIALMAFASLTSSDAVVAKIALPAESAGLYNSAALLGKIAFYGPSALSILLLPLLTARLERKEDVRRLLSLTMLIVVGTGLAVTVALFLAPQSLVMMVFGSGYAEAYPLAAPYALVMTVNAVLYMHLTMALATAESSFIRILVGVAVLQLALFTFLHSSWWQLLAASAVAAGAGLLLHEAISPVGMVRVWRSSRPGAVTPS